MAVDYNDEMFEEQDLGADINEKEKLIEEAESLKDETNWNEANRKANQLKKRWRKIPFYESLQEEDLKERFEKALDVVYEMRNEVFKKSQEIKTNLIQQAKDLSLSEEWNKTTQKLNELMDEWKKAGNAGDKDDELWKQFNEARQVFYDRRSVFYEELHKKQEISYEQKMALVNQAKQIVATNEFTKENTETMKELSAEWKKIGSCGKEKENTIWKEFRSINDEYFDGLTKFNEQKHQDWKKRMIDTRDYKKSQIENQKRQIARLQQDTLGLISEEQTRAIEQQIADKEEFIQKLEAEVADIDKKIGE